ncbi:hypothetical protein TTHERM_00437440 (macronuclear) [Tetrahymena thermophila SB210]|uniref:Uncharacterized protein n=1 Tax=Tetrahymena thermophila (strain SB210) TaxID=312017 RepID=I7MK32_TETTS|nr:hypothetical protein TTHERM_00437440 [Tetrahymena thermophila SB210]EAR97495.2 hypothetical protein TTHERM_00437440 [Tetrahymena thermophila SB210]|eukprot:XP_001017740.2 hypothetical protein TTHERM_00437440 [Tetrahymena thermophila SB210]
MQSFLKEFQLPLDQSQHSATLFQQFQHDRSNSTNCHSSQQKRRTIQELLKQQIHHNRAFKSALNSFNGSPLRDNICSSPKSQIKQGQFNKTFVQEQQSPSNTKKMFLIVTDFNNKHYKIISSTKDDPINQRKQSQSSPREDKGILLSNLRLKQAFVGNIQFESEEDKKTQGSLLKNRPKTVLNSLDIKKRIISHQSNSPCQFRKNKLNQTLRDSTSRQNQSFNDNTSSTQIQLQIDLYKALEAQNASSHQFPANMPVKTRKYRLKKEDVIEKVLKEQRQKECFQAKEKIRSMTQYTQNDLNSSFNKDQYLDSIINSQSAFKNHFDGYNPIQSSLICKGTRTFSNYNSPITKRERYQKIMNQSAQISKDQINSITNSQSELQVNNSSEKKYIQEFEEKIIQSQFIVTPERIVLPSKDSQKFDKKQFKDMSKSDYKSKQFYNQYNNKDQFNHTITQNNTENSICQVQQEDIKSLYHNQNATKTVEKGSKQKNSSNSQREAHTSPSYQIASNVKSIQ